MGTGCISMDLVMKRNIVLIGFMGSGKSVVSQRLASRLKRKIISTDEMMVKREGRSIAEIFRDSGEDYFRQCEKKIIKDISRETEGIIDCGGGVVLDPENLASLKEKGILFYLEASPEIIYQRVKGQRHRPLLDCENSRARIEELLRARRPFYQQADYTIDADRKSAEQACKEIMAVMIKE